MLWTLFFVCLFSFFFFFYILSYIQGQLTLFYFIILDPLAYWEHLFFSYWEHTHPHCITLTSPHITLGHVNFFFFFFLLYTKLYTRTVNFILLFLILLHIGSMFHIGSTYTHTASPHITLGHVIHSLHITTNIANNWNTTIHYRNPGGIEHEVSYK